MRKCTCPETIFSVFPSLSMSREMSPENAYTHVFCNLCLDRVFVGRWLSASFENTLQSVRVASAVDHYICLLPFWSVGLPLEKVIGHRGVDGNIHPLQNDLTSIVKLRNRHTFLFYEQRSSYAHHFQYLSPKLWRKWHVTGKFCEPITFPVTIFLGPPRSI